MLKHKTLAAAWLARVALESNESLWTSIRERDPHFLWQLWKVLFGQVRALGGTKLSLAVLRPHAYSATANLVLITPEEWRNSSYNESRAMMPNPGGAWGIVDPTSLAPVSSLSQALRKRSKGPRK
jgi:hypothetical protein